MDAIPPCGWFWDQLTLVQAWCEARLAYAIIPIHIFADSRLSANAAVWSANVKDKQHYYTLFRQGYELQQQALASHSLS